MKKLWKVLGIAALAVGLTPYKVEKDEKTGENKYQALFWQGTRLAKTGDGEKGEISITVGFNPPVKKEEEAHLFSDDLSVEYASVPVKAENADNAGTEAEPAQSGEEAVQPEAESAPEEAPQTPEETEEKEAPAGQA